MIRKIIKIDEHKCNGCEACVHACHEGAIGMVNGKARLLRDDYCDGLGDCLPSCPTGAITFEEREALEYNEIAVEMAKKKELPCGCSGTHAKTIQHQQDEEIKTKVETIQSQLNQWPIQIKLVPENAAYLQNANLLIAADCSAYAYGNFHQRFIRNHVTLIGCPKLDEGNYAEKLTSILKNNEIKSVSVVRMEVPCCGGIVNAIKEALQACGKLIPWQVYTISTDGKIIEE